MLRATATSDASAPIESDDVEPPIDRRLVVAVIALVGGILLWLVVRLLTSDWLAIGDYRTLQLRVSDVFGEHTPSLGVYSRYTWNHPGPLLFYVLAVPYRLFGSNDVSLLMGSLMVNLAAICTALWVGARAGRRAFVLTAFFLALLVMGMNPAGLADPWNPRIMVIALFTCAVSAWRTVSGDRVAAIAMVVWGSFALQSHLGTALPVVVLTAIGMGALVVRAVRRRGTDLLTLAIVIGIGSLAWLPPLIEQLTSDDGNLSQIVRFLRNPPLATTGPAEGLQIVFRFLSIPGDWVRGLEPTQPSYAFDTGGWSIPWALVALVVALWWAWRRRWMPELVACLVAAALVAVSIVAASRIVGPPIPYLLRWMWAVAAFSWFAPALVALRQWSHTRMGARHGASVVLAATAVVLALMVPRGIDLTPLRLSDSWMRTIEAITPEIMTAIADIDGPIWVSNGYGVDGSTALEVIVRGERSGLDVRRDVEWDYIVGSHRTIDRLDAARELVFLSGDSHFEFDTNPDYVKVAEFDPRTPEQRAEVAALHERHEVVDTTGMTPDEAREARATAFGDWLTSELASDHPSDDFRLFLRTLQYGDLLTVFLSVGPPR